MPDQWYFEFQGKEQGPFLISQLKKLAALGRLQPTDLIWQESHSQKIPASKLKGIFSNSPSLPKAQSRSPVVPPPLPVASASQSGPPPLSNEAVNPDDSKYSNIVQRNSTSTPFVGKHRLWIRAGMGIVVCLVGMICLQIVERPSGKGENQTAETSSNQSIWNTSRSTSPDKTESAKSSFFWNTRGGYTQSILNLSTAEQKEYRIRIPKGAKPLYAPRSVEDFIQSLTLFERADDGVAVYDTHSPLSGGSNIKEINEINGIYYAYQAYYPGGIFLKEKCWNKIYGSRANLETISESTGVDRRFGGGGTVILDHWKVACRGESVLVRGYSRDSLQGINIKKDELFLEFVHFNTTYKSICPGTDGVRRISFGSSY